VKTSLEGRARRSAEPRCSELGRAAPALSAAAKLARRRSRCPPCGDGGAPHDASCLVFDRRGGRTPAAARGGGAGRCVKESCARGPGGTSCSPRVARRPGAPPPPPLVGRGGRPSPRRDLARGRGHGVGLPSVCIGQGAHRRWTTKKQAEQKTDREDVGSGCRRSAGQGAHRRWTTKKAGITKNTRTAPCGEHASHEAYYCQRLVVSAMANACAIPSGCL